MSDCYKPQGHNIKSYCTITLKILMPNLTY